MDVAAAHDRHIGFLASDQAGFAGAGDDDAGRAALQAFGIDRARSAHFDGHSVGVARHGDVARPADRELCLFDVDHAELQRARPGDRAGKRLAGDAVDLDVARAGQGDRLQRRRRHMDGDVAVVVRPIEAAALAWLDGEHAVFDRDGKLRHRLGIALEADAEDVAGGHEDILRTDGGELRKLFELEFAMGGYPNDLATVVLARFGQDDGRRAGGHYSGGEGQGDFTLAQLRLGRRHSPSLAARRAIPKPV
jgi:hypothetical protein